MKVVIDDKDIKKLTKEIDKLIKQSPEIADDILKRTSLHIKSEAKQLAPKKSGWLVKNIRAKKDKDGYSVVSLADYSLYVEYGTRKTSAKPFFRPAIETGMKYMEKEIKKVK